MTAAPPALGDRIAPFTLETTSGPLQVPDRTGRSTLLLFYVESGTPLCSRQLRAFAADAPLLAEANAVAVAISVDPPELQREFAATIGCAEIAFAADPSGDVARRFGVYDEGERRARRAAFVIAGDGTVIATEGWYNPANSAQYAGLLGALLPALEDEDG